MPADRGPGRSQSARPIRQEEGLVRLKADLLPSESGRVHGAQASLSVETGPLVVGLGLDGLPVQALPAAGLEVEDVEVPLVGISIAEGSGLGSRFDPFLQLDDVPLIRLAAVGVDA